MSKGAKQIGSTQIGHCFLMLMTGLSFSCNAPRAIAQDPPIELNWSSPFAQLPSSVADSALILMVVTNDDPYAVSDGSPESQLWCGDVLSDYVRKLIRRRPDLSNRLVLQHTPVGLPGVLTGGKFQSGQGRAIMLIANRDHRLLAMAVGVPDDNDLQEMIEDAEEVSQTLELSKDDWDWVQQQIIKRSGERLDRVWQEVLETSIQQIGKRPQHDDDTPEDQRNLEWRDRVTKLGLVMQAVYLMDVSQRFGLGDSSSGVRLVQVEQHTEARDGWCQTMVPFLVGADTQTLLPPIAEIVWGQPAVSGVTRDQEWITWWNGRPDGESFVLQLIPPGLKRLEVWPPDASGTVAAKKGLDWRGLDSMFRQGNIFRTIETNDLAHLLRETSAAPIQLAQPALARYLYFPNKKDSPVVIRENAVPAKYIGMIKRLEQRQ